MRSHRTNYLFIPILILVISSLAFASERQPNSEYQARRKALAAKAQGGIVLLIAPGENDGPNAIYGFRQDENFYYLTGLTDPGAAILITSEVEVLFLPPRNAVQERWTGPKLNPETKGISGITGFDKVRPLSSIPDELAKIVPSGLTRISLYTDTTKESASTHLIEWMKQAGQIPSFLQIIDLKAVLGALRAHKSLGEIELLKKAADASVAAHLSAFNAIRPGVSEREISSLMQYEFGKRGCERPAYAPIVGSGINSTVLHYSDDSGAIHDGDLVLMDVGGEYSMYATDITRTVPANGKFTSRQREIYDIVLGAQQAAIDAFKSGQSTLGRGPNSLHQVAAEYINTHGKDLHGQPLGQYFIHSLSHHVGLNVHDPNDNVALGPGSVFTIEPGIYITEEKIGVRIEDTFYVNDKGELVNLSGAIPRKAEAIEKSMATGTNSNK